MPGQILQLHSATDARPDPVHRDTARGRALSDSNARPFADQLKQARQSSEHGKALPRGRQNSVPAGRQPDTAGRPQGEARPPARSDERPLPLRKADTARAVQAGRATEHSGTDAKRAPPSIPSSTAPSATATPVETFKARLAQSGLNKADQAKALSQFRQLAIDLEAMMEQAASSSDGLSGEWLDDIAEGMAQLAELLDTDDSLDEDVDFSALIEAALEGTDADLTDNAGLSTPERSGEDGEAEEEIMAPWALDRTGPLDSLVPDADQDWFVMTGDGEWASLEDLAESFRDDQGDDEDMTLMAFSDWLARQTEGDEALMTDDMADLLSRADIDADTPVIWLAAGEALPEEGAMDWADWLMAVPMDDLPDDMEELDGLDGLLASDRFAALFKSEGQTPPVDSHWAVLTPVKDGQSAPPVPMLDARFAQDDQGAVMPAALVGLNGDGDGEGDSEDIEPELELGRDESKSRKDARQALSDALLSRLQSDTRRVGTQEDSGSLRQVFDQGSQRDNLRSPQAMAREHVERQLPVKNSAGELTQQLGERLVIMIGQDIQEARIRLDPPDMGGIDIRVTTQNDQVQVQVVAQQPMVRDLLDQHAQRLREMLEQQGFTDVDVDVSEQPWQDETSDDDADGESGNSSGDGSDDEGDDLPRATTQPLGLVDHYV